MKNKIVVLYGGSGRIGKGSIEIFLKKNIKVINIDPQANKYQKHPEKYISIQTNDFEKSKELLSSKLSDLRDTHTVIGVINFSRIRINKNSNQLSCNEEMNSEIYKVMLFNFIEIIDLLVSENFENFSIVHIGSTNSKLISHQSILYHSIKGAIESTNRAIAYKLAPKNIRSNMIIPGIVKDPDMKANISINEKASIPLKRGAAKPKDIGELVYFLISEESKYITGSSILIDSGLSLPDSFTVIDKLNELKS